MDMSELDGLAGVDALFGIDGLKEDLMDVGMLGVAAGAAVVAGEYIFGLLDSNLAKMAAAKPDGIFKPLPPYAKAGVAVALGAAGGIAVGRMSNKFGKTVGAGIAAGLIGWGISKAVQKAAKLPSVDLGQVSDRDLLLGMGVVDNDVAVSDYRPLPGQTNGFGVVDNDITASDYRPIPGQTNGFGQAGDVRANDMQPMPGQNGSDGYMQGIGSFLS